METKKVSKLFQCPSCQEPFEIRKLYNEGLMLSLRDILILDSARKPYVLECAHVVCGKCLLNANKKRFKCTECSQTTDLNVIQG